VPAHILARQVEKRLGRLQDCGRHPRIAGARKGGDQAVALTLLDGADAAVAGDPQAGLIVRRAATYMGHALVNLTNLFDPEVIVVGGGVTRSWSQVEPVMKAVLHASPFIRPARRPRLRRARLGERVGEVGAVECSGLAMVSGRIQNETR